MASLETARRLYLRQQRLTLASLSAVRQATSLPALASAVSALQVAAVRLSVAAVGQMVEEQGLNAPAVAPVVPQAFVGASDGRNLLSLLQAAADRQALETIVRTQVADAGRVAAGVATVTRPKLDGHVRHVNPPSCSRCVILAGRFYRWSTGFNRHPRCDCVMVPTTQEASGDLVADPMEAFRSGQITDLSKADARAVKDGADLGQVVNVRRSQAGLSMAGRVVQRGAKATPEGIYLLSSSRDEALALLRRHGYIL